MGCGPNVDQAWTAVGSVGLDYHSRQGAGPARPGLPTGDLHDSHAGYHLGAHLSPAATSVRNSGLLRPSTRISLRHSWRSGPTLSFQGSLQLKYRNHSGPRDRYRTVTCTLGWLRGSLTYSASRGYLKDAPNGPSCSNISRGIESEEMLNGS
jgi:hypothetical protein